MGSTAGRCASAHTMKLARAATLNSFTHPPYTSQMSSTARRKIDPSTMDLFDKEVDRPEHDAILTRLLNDEVKLQRVLQDLHCLTDFDPFTEETIFHHHPSLPGATATFGHNLEQAKALTGVAPTWTSTSPIRILRKRAEVLLLQESGGRYPAPRLMGFADIVVAYDVIKFPTLIRIGEGRLKWRVERESRIAVIEVKSAWPTVGNLLRQLNLYRWCSPLGFDGVHRTDVVIGPDDSVMETVSQHGYRLVTFNALGDEFSVVNPSPKTLAPTSDELGSF